MTLHEAIEQLINLGNTDPQEVAIRLLRERIADGHAGVDPYDPSVFILTVRVDELAWATKAIHLTGWLLTVVRQAGTLRFRSLLEADVRRELGLDGPAAAVMEDEPLASRAVGSEGWRRLRVRRRPTTAATRKELPRDRY